MGFVCSFMGRLWLPTDVYIGTAFAFCIGFYWFAFGLRYCVMPCLKVPVNMHRFRGNRYIDL